MPKVDREVPRNLRPYFAHGVVLTEDTPNAKGDCPFCGRSGKFSVRVETGLARCFVCDVNPDSPKGGINPRSFIQRLWELARDDTTDRDLEGLLALRRGVRSVATLRAWGCAKGGGGEWLLPGWDHQGRMCQLYRWGRDKILRATPKADGILGAGLFGVLDAAKPEVWVCEGPWDGMALEEVLGVSRRDENGGLRAASDPALSLLAEAGVVAVAGCGSVGEPFRALLPAFDGKRVTLCFDNDHPRRGPSGAETAAGRDAARRAAELLAPVAASVSWLEWGEGGFDPALKSGFDMRDALGEVV